MDTSFGDFIAFSALSDGNDTNQQNQQRQHKDNKFQGKKKVDADGDSLSETDDDAAEGSLCAPKIIIKSISSNRRAYVAAVPEDDHDNNINGNNNEDGALQSGTDDDENDSYSQSNPDCGDETPENGNDDVHTNTGRSNGDNCNKSNKKVGSSTVPPQSQQTKKSTAEYTEQFRDVTCDVFRGPDAPVHAMFHLTQSITVRGPCAVIGLCGQCLVQGYLLRQRSVIIPDFSSNNNNSNNATASGSGGGGGAGGQAHVAVQPIPPSCRKTVFNELVKGWSSSTSSGSVAIMQNLSQGVPINRNDPSIKEDLDTIAEIESIFGKINWSWTRQVLESWKQRFGRSSDLTVVLVIAESHLHQHITIAPQQQQPQQKKGSGNNNNKSSSSDFSRLPFFAPRMASVPHNKLLHSLLPELVTSPSRKFLQEQNVDGANQQNNTASLPPSVLIAGSVNTGKSTTARYLCNLLVSLYGACLWLDLDLGQSEFAPPGGIGLFKVTEPLISSNQYRGVENILTHYLGTTTMRDPVATAKAIENICNKVSELHHRHHNGQEGASNNGGGSRRQRPSDDVGGENIGNNSNNNAQRQQQQQKQQKGPLPIVINTHGWVLSTGRRATIEVLQRLCPSQVVHLFAPTCTDKEWLLPSGGVINDPARGLNSKVFLESKFSSNSNTITTTTSTTTSSQAATGLLPAPVTKKWSFTIHRYIHEKLFEKDASDGRARAWTRYFWNSQAPMNENRSTAASLMLSSLSMAQALEKSEKAELVDFSANNNSNNNNNNTASKNKVSIPTEIHSRPGKIISIPFDKVRLVFAEEEQMPWQFRGRISKLIEPSSSKNNNAANEENKHKFSITALTPAIKAELLDSISGALVALGTTKNLSNISSMPSSSSSLEISQLSCESNPPNIFGYGIILCAADSDSAANNFSSVKVVVPSDVAEVVEKEILTASSMSTTGQKPSGNDNAKRSISSSSSMKMMINLVIGWQQYDTNWNQDMAKVALRGGV